MAYVVAYLKNQKQHHQRQTTIAIYERMTEEDDGPSILSDG